MKKFLSTLSTLVVLILLIKPSLAQKQIITSRQIDSLVNKTMELMPLAGIAVAVIKDGKVIHAKGYGVATIKGKEKVDENTLFAIASNSKSFTAAALAILVDEGKLTWHDKVVDHLPEFKMYDPYVTANFNIQDLLTHRSGLGLGAGDLMFFPDGADFTIKDILKSFQYQKPVSAFRTQFDYDNLLYMVAGEVVSKVSGMSWAAFVEQRIMKPLGMTRSVSQYKNLKDLKNTAMPHSVVRGELKQLEPFLDQGGSLGAAGGIYSSVSDLSKWLTMHLNDAKYGESLKTQLISPVNHHEMLKPHTFMDFTVKPDPRSMRHLSAYGLGWDIEDQLGHILISHTGGLPGMLSRTAMVPELNLGVVVLTNTDPGGYSFLSISTAILDSYLGKSKRDEIGRIAQWIKARDGRGDSVTTAVWNIVKAAKTDHLKWTNYTGTYRDNWFGEVKIDVKEGQLFFTSVRSPKLIGKMFYYKANTFAIKWNYQDMECDAFATFNTDEEGSATSIRMKGISPNIDFSFDFHDLDLQRVN
jgi:CubicO group peptidase (beta-lactamase class C family)